MSLDDRLLLLLEKLAPASWDAREVQRVHPDVSWLELITHCSMLIPLVSGTQKNANIRFSAKQPAHKKQIPVPILACI